MQTYSSSSVPPPGPKNYVFVDEHNRHKRLKVMRACEGCRRRKIKCDSATTNTWPCAACVRLKLHCVPPAGGLDGDATNDDSVTDDSIDAPSFPTQGAASVQRQDFPVSAPAFQLNQGETYNYEAYVATYPKPPYDNIEKPFEGYYPGSHQFPGALNGPYQAPVFNSQQAREIEPLRTERAGSGSSPIDHMTAEDLAGHLGTLRIGDTGVADYLREENIDNKRPEVPVQEPEPEARIAAAFRTDAGSQIRIPPALMPSDEDALLAFRTFFQDVHPYAPVLSRNQFYHQWNTDRASISPLLLEAILANSGRLSDDPAQGAQWLALANRHEACFLDIPRLSTLQALLLLLKARESAPKRGYYYRSWMTCKTAVIMAKDLELHEHFETHTSGELCGFDPVECLNRTRIWQTLLVCEMMIGAPQGRRDMGVDPNSVDISPSPPNSDIDDFEKSISEQFAYFVRNARNIRLIGDISQKLKKKKDWGLDPSLVAYNVAFKNWPNDLPEDLQIIMPPDGSNPTISSHFVGNMHSHYHLGIVMLHRPQLSASQSFATDSQWKHHMSVSYNSAKILCRIQEGILANFGLTGLLYMQRGINFTIYAILTCIMLHLIALSSPDAEFNSEARDYFVRHMRILERCVAAWPMPETEAQINALRAAFSADLNKPFELKASFPLGSPSEQSRPSPGPYPAYEPPSQGSIGVQPQQAHPQPQLYIPNQMQQMRQNSAGYLATPPVSAYTDSKPQTPIYSQPYEISEPGPSFPQAAQQTFYQQTPTSAPDLSWNPTPIINQFDTAFAIPPSALAPPPSLYSTGSSPPGSNLQNLNTSFASTQSPTYPEHSPYPPNTTYSPHTYFPPQYQATTSPVAGHPGHPGQQVPSSSTSAYGGTGADAGIGQAMFVTPKQWQQSVASAIDPQGLKRRWDYDARHQ